jgi:hypothetical protein
MPCLPCTGFPGTKVTRTGKLIDVIFEARPAALRLKLRSDRVLSEYQYAHIAALDAVVDDPHEFAVRVRGWVGMNRWAVRREWCIAQKRERETL